MNQNYDFSQYFTHNILIYKFFGFWRPDKDMQFKRLYNCYTVLCVCIWVAFLVSQITYIIANIKNVTEITATLCVTMTFFVDLIKMMAIYVNMNQIKDLIKKLNRPLFQVKCQKHYEIAEATKKMNKIMFGICCYLGGQTALFWIIFPSLSEERTIPSRGWFPYDWNEPVYFLGTYIFQSYVYISNAFICLNLDTFTSTLLIQVGLQCDLLCSTLDYLDDFYVENGFLYAINLEDKMKLRENEANFSRAMTKNLVVCIYHHREIMRVAKEVERIHQTSVFVLFLGGAFVICSSLFQLSVIEIGSLEFFRVLFYLICMLTEQFIYCWFGNELIYKSSLILNAAYNTPWIYCDIKFRKVLLQFMTQASRPISILTGGLFEMSVGVFVSVLRTAYSYYTLLKRIQ